VSDDEDDDDDDEYNTTSRVKNPLTPRITLALQLSKSILDKQKKEVNFTRIIMRFPKIHNVFDRIIKIHDKYDLNKDGRVQLPELTDAMKELMANSEDKAQDSDFTKQVENIFMLSDLDHHGLQKGLDVKELSFVLWDLSWPRREVKVSSY
jgi:calcium-binding protein CML